MSQEGFHRMYKHGSSFCRCRAGETPHLVLHGAVGGQEGLDLALQPGQPAPHPTQALQLLRGTLLALLVGGDLALSSKGGQGTWGPLLPFSQ